MKNSQCPMCLRMFTQSVSGVPLLSCEHSLCSTCFWNTTVCPVDSIRFRESPLRPESTQLKQTEPQIGIGSSGSVKTRATADSDHQIEEICLLHSKPTDVICLADGALICCNCALFGEHRGHRVEDIQGFINRLTVLAEETLPLYQQTQEQILGLSRSNFIEQATKMIKTAQGQAEADIREKFNHLSLFVKECEKSSIQNLRQIVDQQLGVLEKSSKTVVIPFEIRDWLLEIEHLAKYLAEISRHKDCSKDYTQGVLLLPEHSNLMKRGQESVMQATALKGHLEEQMQSYIKNLTVQFCPTIFQSIKNCCGVRVKREVLDPIVPPETESNQDNLLANGSDTLTERTLESIELHPEPICHRLSSLHRDDINREPEPRRKKKLELPQKYKGVFEDLKNDRSDVIDFTGAEFGDQAVPSICEEVQKTKKLRILKLIRNKLTDETIPEILEACLASQVTSLNLSQNFLTDKCLLHLENLPCKKLKNITLSLNKVNRRNAKHTLDHLSRKGVTITL